MSAQSLVPGIRKRKHRTLDNDNKTKKRKKSQYELLYTDEKYNVRRHIKKNILKCYFKDYVVIYYPSIGYAVLKHCSNIPCEKKDCYIRIFKELSFSFLNFDKENNIIWFNVQKFLGIMRKVNFSNISYKLEKCVFDEYKIYISPDNSESSIHKKEYELYTSNNESEQAEIDKLFELFKDYKPFEHYNSKSIVNMMSTLNVNNNQDC